MVLWRTTETIMLYGIIMYPDTLKMCRHPPPILLIAIETLTRWAKQSETVTWLDHKKLIRSEPCLPASSHATHSCLAHTPPDGCDGLLDAAVAALRCRSPLISLLPIDPFSPITTNGALIRQLLGNPPGPYADFTRPHWPDACPGAPTPLCRTHHPAMYMRRTLWYRRSSSAPLPATGPFRPHQRSPRWLHRHPLRRLHWRPCGVRRGHSATLHLVLTTRALQSLLSRPVRCPRSFGSFYLWRRHSLSVGRKPTPAPPPPCHATMSTQSRIGCCRDRRLLAGRQGSQ